MEYNSREYWQAINNIIRQNYAKGTPDRIQSEIRRFCRANKIKADKEAAQIRKLAESTQADKYAQSKYSFDKNSVAKLEKSFAQAKDAINEDIVSAVLLGLRQGEGTTAILERLKRVQNTTDFRLGTIANTARIAGSRADNIQKALDAGCKYFRYVGPSGGREFCAEHLGKVYHIDEIMAMSNGQGLSVMWYCGGWNCRHRWEPVFDYKTEK